MKAVFDTNILIDYLKGISHANKELALYRRPCISIVTWMEVQVGLSDSDRGIVNKFLNRFEIIPLSQEIAETAVNIRKAHRLRLPDAIIWATAQELETILVTRNTKDFPAKDVGVRVPY
ncbi:MAG: hypothetical protein ACD_62C00003G0005 [uncultured bacterium]|nr:MAG: hypothetical protein ACD_62C00003G0005 [uncultured bacterium]